MTQDTQPDTRDTLPEQPEPARLCSHCGFTLPKHGGGLREYGFHTAHRESECLRLLHAEIERLEAATAQQAQELQALRADAERLRYALGDSEGKLNASQLTRRAYELFQKAAQWNDWCGAQNRVETDMPEGWAFVIQCSPGDWDTYLTDPDGERVSHRDDCDTLAQQMNSAVDVARAARQDGAGGHQR